MRKKTKLIPGKTKKVISRQYYDVVKSGGKDALRSIIQRRHLKSGLHINMIAEEITEAAFNTETTSEIRTSALSVKMFKLFQLLCLMILAIAACQQQEIE